MSKYFLDTQYLYEYYTLYSIESCQQKNQGNACKKYSTLDIKKSFNHPFPPTLNGTLICIVDFAKVILLLVSRSKRNYYGLKGLLVLEQTFSNH